MRGHLPDICDPCLCNVCVLKLRLKNNKVRRCLHRATAKRIVVPLADTLHASIKPAASNRCEISDHTISSSLALEQCPVHLQLSLPCRYRHVRSGRPMRGSLGQGSEYGENEPSRWKAQLPEYRSRLFLILSSTILRALLRPCNTPCPGISSRLFRTSWSG